MNTNRQWLLAKRPFGEVGKENFEYAETPIPEPGDGEVLVRNLFLSFDPTQRGWMEDRESYLPPVQLGEPMRAGSVGQVTESNHPDFATGDLVQTTGGWQDFVIASPGQGPMGLSKVPDGLSPEMMMSVLGVTGLTAYWGLLDLGDPRAGEALPLRQQEALDRHPRRRALRWKESPHRARRVPRLDGRLLSGAHGGPGDPERAPAERLGRGHSAREGSSRGGILQSVSR